MNFKLYRNLPIGFAGLLMAAALFIPALRAQNAGQPARAARLSYVDGKVQLSQGGQLLADQAVINAPLFEGTEISTGDDGKAEIQLEDGSVARLSPASSVTLKTLNNSQSEMTLNHGLAYFELQTGGQSGQLSVDFADSTVTPSGFTILRVNMDNPPGALAVFSGNAHVERSAGSSVDLHGGESVEFNSPNPTNIADAIQPDSWDAWNSDRDQALNAEASTQSPAATALAGANASTPAWSDLNANGNWYNVPGQGYVWSPYDASNPSFDPYGNGAWMQTPGYGYVWASGYPWGYLPYQCGAWNFYDNFGWGWAPGFGGCNPWWGAGFYGGPVFGVLPIGYAPLRMPTRGRIPHPGRPIIVSRNSFHAGFALPARTPNAAVTIAGHSVQPLHPVPTRSIYARAAEIHADHVGPIARVQPGGPRSAYVPGSRPVYHAPQPGAFNRSPAPGNFSSPIQRNNSAPVQRYSPPPQSGSRPPASAPPAPHYSAPPPPSGGGNSGGGGGAHNGSGHR